MSRTYDDWIQAYLQYNKKTESAKVFHKWAAISAIAGCLRRKVHFNFGRIKIHPNMYIIFVAEPGIARKTQAITFMEDFLADIYGIHLAADATTPQALLNAIEEAADDAQMNNGDSIRHCSLTICSGEFESFLGHKKENSRMIVILTDLFDCKTRPFRYNTKHSGSNVLPLPFLNLIAATTPDSLSECFPTAAIGGGLSSRIMFIYADDKEMKIPIPELNAERQAMFDPLMKDLSIIARMSGGFNFSPSGKEWWYDFYNKFEERDPKRMCKDPAFMGWYSRKPLLMLKIVTCLSAAKRGDRLVSPEDLIVAKQMIEEVEPDMGRAFSAVGRSELTADIDMVRKILERYKTISEKQLRRMVWRDIDDKKFPSVIDTIVKAGDAARKYAGPKGEKGIWYYWGPY
ncbi:MAG: DUF3987 domain-containing protein [Candidatus Peribacteraceae bacterium]|nr:DUF3987 domain-containing protein [Candidatus Peribacteraceae bacterium]